MPVATLRLTWLLAALGGGTALVGLLFRDAGFYASYAVSLAALVGQDIATLVVAVPVLVGAAWLARSGSPMGLLAWAGALFYLAYSYFFLVVGATATGFIPYLLLIAGSIAGLVSLLVAVNADAVAERFTMGRSSRPVAAYLFGTGLLFTLMWGAISLGATLGGTALDPVVHLVIVADACVLLPALLVAGWRLWHREAWGVVLAGILLVKVPMTAGTVAFGTLLNAAWTGSLSEFDAFLTALFGAVTIAALALLVPFARSFGHPEAAAPAAR